MFTTVSELQQTFAKSVKMISSFLSIEIRVHMIDNGNNEIRGSGVERDAGGDEKQSSLSGLRWSCSFNYVVVMLTLKWFM